MVDHYIIQIFRSGCWIALAIISLTMPSVGLSAAKTQLVKHPNVLFISLDDMNDWVGPLAGNDQSITPSLDRFAQNRGEFHPELHT